MTRVAAFVLVVAGLVYLALDMVLGEGGWLDVGLDRRVAASLSVIAGILAWTAFLWSRADRLGRKDDSWHESGEE